MIKIIPAGEADVSAFAAAVRGTLARSWPDVRAASGAGLVELWPAAADQGWFDLGAEGALAAAVAAVRELGRVACPFPLLDAYLATWLFRHDERVIEEITAGRMRVIAAVPGENGRARHLDAAAEAGHLLAIPPAGGTATLSRLTEVRATPGLAAPDWSDVATGEIEARADITAEDADEAIVLLRLQVAVRALAAAGRAHDLALEHAKQRRQFGKAIGSFGAVQQRTAACQIDVSAGDLLIADALRSFERGGHDRLLAAEIAVEHARVAAPRVQLGAHHTLAAIGYFEEHEAPWLFRRVHADLARLGTFVRVAGDVADVLAEGTGTLPAKERDEAAEDFRAKVRHLFEGRSGTGTMAVDKELTREVAERGWLGMAWPPEAGGRGAPLAEEVILNEEATYHRAPVAKALGAVMLLGTSILKHGTQAQKDTFLPLIRRGELDFCLGYSEPEAGSDLASLRTSAVRDGDDWVINGQKLWTTGGHTAGWVWLATRTDPEAQPRHAGITVFLIPMKTPGITVQQHRALSGEISCTVFYDDVRVPDSMRVGEVNGGWRVITDALAGERITMGNIAAALHRQLDDLLDVVRTDPEQVVGPRGSARRARLRDLAVGVQACRALVASAIQASGDGSRLHAPMAGVMGGELAEEFGEAVLDILGPQAALSAGVPGVPGGGAFEYGLRLSVMYVVGGGTNDIQRGLIARGLGLPR